MPHVVLLGDSVFDNAAYTGGGPDVISQLRARLPGRWRSTLLAIDGSTTDDIGDQLEGIPTDASHAVLSVGGNDAIRHADILDLSVQSSAEVLSRLSIAAAGFEARYRRVVDAVRNSVSSLVVCTVYNGDFPDPDFQRIASTALTAFNDVILRVAIEQSLIAVDLRLICEPGDYVNHIEPSSEAGAKIAAAVQHALELQPSADSVARIVAA